ncbi:helix-turn-helix transcriptional regulator [Streptomyces sp. 900105245]
MSLELHDFDSIDVVHYDEEPTSTVVSVTSQHPKYGDGAWVKGWVARAVEADPDFPVMTEVYSQYLRDRHDAEGIAHATRSAKLAIIAKEASRSVLAPLRQEVADLDEGFAETDFALGTPFGGGAHFMDLLKQQAATPENFEQARASRAWEFERVVLTRIKNNRLAGRPQQAWDLQQEEQVRGQAGRIKEIHTVEFPLAVLRITTHFMGLGLNRAEIGTLMKWNREYYASILDGVTVTQAAELVGVQPSTWRGYVARGQAPAGSRRVGREPAWRLEEILQWQATRPGPGRPRKQPDGT